MIAVGFANGAPWPDDQGRFLLSFDFDAYNGKGEGEFTFNPAHAMQFASHADALLYWRTVSTVRPKRPDGKPNRPLTSTTVQIEELSEYVKGKVR